MKDQLTKGTFVEVRLKAGAKSDTTASTVPCFFPVEGNEQGPLSHAGWVCEVTDDFFCLTPGWDHVEQRVAEPGFTGGVNIYYGAVYETVSPSQPHLPANR
jgi:hypothetical protein